MDQTLRDQIAQMHAQICMGLADANRILILYTLHEGPHTVGELAQSIGLPQSTVSRHLKVLRERSLVFAQRSGQTIIYSLSDERVIHALEILRQVMADSLEGQVILARQMPPAMSVPPSVV